MKPDVDEGLQPAVRFEFDARGAARFGRLTHEHRPEEGGAFQYQLAILLDNLVMSAPAAQERNRQSGHHRRGTARILQAKEVEHLVQVLRAGSLPASLNPDPVQEEKVGPTLGELRSPSRATSPSGSRCSSCRSSWSYTIALPGSSRSSHSWSI